MPKIKSKKPITPISLEMSPLKKSSSTKKIGIIKRNKNRKMVSFRMRKDIYNLMDDMIRKIKKETNHKFSQSGIIEMALLYASSVPIADLLNAYGDSFKMI